MLAPYKKRFIDQAVRSRFITRHVNVQDLCRYYKLDFWGALHRNLDKGKKLSVKLYGRRLRLSKRAWRAKQMKSGRFELLKLDDQRFKPRKRIPRYFSVIHNKERFRLYWRLSEQSLRHMILKPSFSGHQRYALGNVTHRFAARIDQFLFANRFAATLEDARILLKKAVFVVNGHLVRRADQQLGFMDLLEFRTGSSVEYFRSQRRAWFRRLSISLVDIFQKRFHLLRRKKRTLLKARSRRSRFKLKWFRTLRLFRRFRRDEMEFIFRTPNSRRFFHNQGKVLRYLVDVMRGLGENLKAINFAVVDWLAMGRYVARNLLNVTPKVQLPRKNKINNLISKGVVLKSLISWAGSFVGRAQQSINLNVGTNFFRTAKDGIRLRPILRGQLFYENPFFILFLKAPRRTYLPCRASAKLVASSYVRTRLRQAFLESDVFKVRTFTACVL
jgi:hypothetical protein